MKITKNFLLQNRDRKKTAETEGETEIVKNDNFVEDNIRRLNEDLNLVLRDYRF